MIGKQAVVLILALGTLAWASQLYSQEAVESLRGAQAINETSPTPREKPWQGKTDPIVRNYKEQPPLIPHKSQSFKINLEKNKCLDCHSPANYVKKEAPKPSATHFVDRDGNKLDHISRARYFCTQCHVEQRDAAPLVENDYAGTGNTP